MDNFCSSAGFRPVERLGDGENWDVSGERTILPVPHVDTYSSHTSNE